MLGGGKVKQIYTLHGEKASIRAISRELGVSRNTVRKYLRAPELPKPAPRPARCSKLDPYKQYITEQVNAGVDNCVVLLKKLKEKGYQGSYTLLKDFVHPLRRQKPKVTVRYETEPGEQAQVDFGCVQYKTPDGTTHKLWVFVMVLSWSRAIYVEFIQKADLATFMRCHINAFSALGGITRKCLYDNTKVVVLGRDESGLPVFNTRFLDFAKVVGFDPRLCHPYRPQTKGRVESGVKYVKRNFWLGTEHFSDLHDLNLQAAAWCANVANVRVHGTTHERPIDRLEIEKPHLLALPEERRLQPFLREERNVGRDGFVQWENAWYGLPAPWQPGQKVQVQPRNGYVEIWHQDKLLAVHPLALKAGQRFKHPRQWDDVQAATNHRQQHESVPCHYPECQVDARDLRIYEAVAEAVSVA